MFRVTLSAILLSTLLTACDQINQRMGLDVAAKNEAEGKAVGGACRHSGRAIEDCYSIYTWLPKASVYQGWRDMDAYMRENQIETIAPQLPPAEPPTKKKKKSPAKTEESTEEAGSKTDGKHEESPAKH